jgi:hypothetical protein
MIKKNSFRDSAEKRDKEIQKTHLQSRTSKAIIPTIKCQHYSESNGYRCKMKPKKNTSWQTTVGQTDLEQNTEYSKLLFRIIT